ncbi:MAG TPA: Xaa-Pro peptidase family protein [Alphaproteobacteria bacterium]|nr:Xaa-Pro peptidase family protein [Alphaproteobacteria bacterium]
MNYSARQKKLAARLRQAGAGALLVTHLPNIRYLCGFTGSAGVLVVIAGARGAKSTLYTDGRYAQQAAGEVRGARVTIGGQPALLAACEGVLKAKIQAVGFESEHLTHSAYLGLGKLLRNKAKLKPSHDLVEIQRQLKDSDEIAQIRAAALLGASLFPTLLAAARPGVSERMVAAELEMQARKAGAEGMSFETIVAAGPRSALPHGRASSQPIPTNGFIIMDYGVILSGYCSDMTRTVYLGKITPARRRMYEAVKAAQLASIEAVRPGAEAGQVDQAGRLALKKAGYEVYFTHSTGHGVGLEIHESPRLAKGQTKKLEPGMVITVEPGIYIPEAGGVRIEDMVLVTETGHEVLTPVAKDLIEL